MNADDEVKSGEPQGTAKSQVAPMRTVLLVDDHNSSRITTKWFLASFGYAVDSLRSAEEALALFDPQIHDLVVTDNAMPGMKGTEMGMHLRRRSQRGWRAREGVSLYVHLDHLGLVSL